MRAVRTDGIKKPRANSYTPGGKPPAFSCWRRCPQADVEGTPCGIAVLKKTFRLQIPRFGFVYLPTLALVIGVPSTSAACGRHLRKPEKAFWAFNRGYTNSPKFSPHRFCVPPLIHRKRSPFPVGEGYGLPSGGIRSTKRSIPPVFRRLVADRVIVRLPPAIVGF